MRPDYVLFPNYRKALTLFICLLCLSLKSFATLTCPPNQQRTAPPQQCEVQLDFGQLVWSSSVPLTDTVFTPGPGFPFPVGSTTITLTGTEVGGGTVSCSFTMTVQEASPQLICKDNVMVHLDSTCSRVITPAMIFHNPPVCTHDFIINFINPQGILSPAVATINHLGNGPHIVKGTHVATGQSCWGSIIVNEGTIPFSITCPPDTTVRCNQSLDPTSVGQPIVVSCLDSADFIATHLDNVTITTCASDNTLEMLRTWKATDIFGNERSCQQHINARRGTLDQITFPNDVTIPCSDALSYQQQIEPNLTGLPLLSGGPVDIECDMSLEHIDSITHVCGASYEIMRQWLVIDWCKDDVLSHMQLIHIVDDTSPLVGLPDTIYISTNPACGFDANFPAAVISGECSTYTVEMTTPWNTTPGNGGVVAVNTVASGSYPASYTVTDACGNVTNEAVVLQVEAGAVVACPQDTTITCDFFNTHIAPALALGNEAVLDEMGTMELYANCIVTTTQTVDVAVDSCGMGTIVRTLGAEGLADQCVQTIEVVHVTDFVVQFPADVTLECGLVPLDMGEPVVVGESCEHVELTYTDQTFNVVPDACYKIVRTWVGKNTCMSNSNNPVLELPETQSDPSLCDFDGDGDCDNHTYRVVADGYVRHQQVIKIRDAVEPVFVNGCTMPDVCTDSATCAATIMLPTPLVDDCSPVTLTPQLHIGGVWLSGPGPYLNIPKGTYNIRYTASDPCNNDALCTTTVKVVDCEPPTAECKDAVAIAFFASGQVDLWASDLNNGSNDNCSGTLKYSLSPDVTDIGNTYNCDDLGARPVELWVTDLAGNQSTCSVAVTFVDNGGYCDPLEIMGWVYTEQAIGVSNVMINLVIDTAFTDNDGFYMSNELSNSSIVEITPYHDEFHSNGVSTFDAVLIRKHILDIAHLDSPYKLIAADVNRSNTITTFDLVALTKVVLGNAPNFPNNTSWRFIPAYFQFPTPANPFLVDFPESIDFSSPPFTYNLNFVAIKVGDVNGSAVPNLSGPGGGSNTRRTTDTDKK